jgi:RNA polymerase sigma factor (sigma-70 family)
MPPPPAEPFAARVFLGPVLRAQPDRRLVKLVREGYETAFEEIVRRYRKPLDRFAAAIVGSRSEDVTQDAFSKALLALRGTTMEIELRPWLYRIVRNTALNDLRDAPPLTEELGETIPGGLSAAVEAERREEIGELMGRLRALPEPQRAAIVMRELEGLSHEEIAAALGVSGGAARQAIYRARLTLRNGLGMLIPLPLLRVLFDHAAEATGAGAGGAIAAASAASMTGGGGAGATVGGFGAAGALKVGVATALLAGSVGAGVAMQHDRGGRSGPKPAEASAALLPTGGGSDASAPPGSSDSPSGPGAAPLIGSAENRGRGGRGSGDDDDGGRGDHSGHGGEDIGEDSDFDDPSHGDSGSSPGGSSGHGGRGSGHGGRSGSGEDIGEDHSGEGTSAESHSGRHDSGGGSENSGHGGGSSGSSGHGSGSGGSGGDSDGGSSGGSGHSGSSGHDDSDESREPAPVTSPPPAPEPPPADSDNEESGSGNGGPGSGGGGSGDDEDDS